MRASMNTDIMVLGPGITMISRNLSRLQNHFGTCSTLDPKLCTFWMSCLGLELRNLFLGV